MAARLARKFVTVGGIVQAVERSIAEGIAAARAVRPLAEGSPMAVELGTRYPILQGPMTRVSDVAPFAEAVARDGGLPFVALAMLRGDEVRALLDQTAVRLAGTALGRGHPGFRHARAPRRAARGRRRGPAAVGADRRWPARPGRRAGATGDPHVPARPLAGTAGAIPPRRLPPVRARGARVRRPRRPSVELRALGAGRGRRRRRHRPGHPGRRDQPGLRRRHPRRPVRGDGRRDGRPAGGARGQGRRTGRHRVPLHPRGGRDRRDRATLPGRGHPLPRHGAARVGAGAPGAASAPRRSSRGSTRSAAG